MPELQPIAEADHDAYPNALQVRLGTIGGAPSTANADAVNEVIPIVAPP